MLIEWLRRLARRRTVEARAPAAPPARVAQLAAQTGALPIDDLALITLLGLPTSEPPPASAVAMVSDLIRDEASKGIPLPPFPATAARVLEQVERTELDLNEIVRTLTWEPAITAEILAAANSAAYQRDIDDLRSALMVLGLRQVAAIAIGIATSNLFNVHSRAEFELYPELWYEAHRDGMVLALTASWLAHAKRVPRYDRVFLRGMLYGTVRKIALRALARPLLDGRCPFKPMPEVVIAAVDSVHRELATTSLGAWSLPASVSMAIDPRNQHEQAIVELVSSLIHVRRDPSRGETWRIREIASQLELGTSWMRVLVRECVETTTRVEMQLRSQATRGPSELTARWPTLP